MNSYINLLIEELESTANFCRGASLDPRIPKDSREALLQKANHIDDYLERLDNDFNND